MDVIEAPPAPLPPSEDEQKGYYYGLPSQPRLVARSSTDRWEPPRGNWPRGKLFDPVGQHRIANLWNDPSTSTLRQDIVEALGSIRWTAIDVLRLGYEAEDFGAQEQQKNPITLLVSVESNSTSWEQGHAAVMQCRRILQQHHINDVHCDMKEASVVPLASPPTAPPTAPKLITGNITHPEEVYNLFSEYLGHSIATHSLPTREGTKCLYLRLKGTGKVLALTCRHVVFGKEALNEDYRHDESAPKSAVTVIQPGDGCLEGGRTICKGTDHTEDIIKLFENDDGMSEDDKKANIAIERANRRGVEQAEKLVEEHNDKDKRIFGHVLFSPKISNTIRGTTGPRVQPRLRDWALIELHPGKHTTPLADLKNRVSITVGGLAMLTAAKSAENFPIDLRLAINSGNHTIALRGRIPEREMKNPPMEAKSTDDPAILVAKHGRSTGFTVGLANNVVSVKRQPIDNVYFLSEEWCIIGQKKNRDGKREKFSHRGDSGACV
ncbi:hypothetical protein AK830_g11792 [Neonectria ditissima]|uniref:Uncharacterized protein n=1 Tax=Neonectria ditissima TaxID=78410 RepID=A0A0P7B296_9HYPO|nr:hypothetical protein AK830_g11792 [Neonectria ditissima]